MFDNVVNKKIIEHFYNIKTCRGQLLFIEGFFLCILSLLSLDLFIL